MNGYSLPRTGRSLGRSFGRLAGGALLAGTLAAWTTPREAPVRMPTAATAYAAFEGSARRVPLVSLPDAGQASLVEETRTQGGLRQRIAFGRDGASRGELALGIAGSAGGTALAKPTKRGIEAELAALQGGPYRVRTQPARNAYGPLGIAVGGRCVFAWQWIEDLHGIEPAAGLATPGRVSASLRVHHCGRGSPDALVADLTRLRLGAAGPERIARAPRRPRAPKAAAAPPAAAEAVVPSVPSPVARPLVTVNESRTLISLPQERSPTQDPATPGRPAVPRPGAAGTDALDQPRYLSDTALSRVPPTPGTASAPAPNRRETLSSDLPAQAYRGPAPPPFGW